MNASKDLRKFLSLGEQILKYPNTAAQCEFIKRTIKDFLQCNIDIWFLEPYYPLPGEPPVKTFPRTQAPEIVRNVIPSHQSQQTHIETDSDHSSQTIAAFPIESQEMLLGIVFIEMPPGQDLSRHNLSFLEGFLAHAAVSMQISRQVVIKNWRAEQLELVQSVSEQISNIFDLNELCQQITNLIQRSFNYYHVGIYTLNEKTDTLHLRAAANLCESGDSFLAPKIHLGEGIIGLAAQEGKELLSPDTSIDNRFRFMDNLPETRSEYSLPLIIESRVLGVLDIQSDQADKFHEIDMLVLRSLSNNIALAINNANLLNEAKQKTEQLSAVIEFNLALTSILDLDVLVNKTVHLIQERFGYPFVHFFTIHPVRHKIIYAAGSGQRSQAMQENLITYDIDEPKGIIPWVARNNQTFQSDDVTQDGLYVESSLPPSVTRSELSVPISYAGDVLAVLDIQSDQTSAFNENDRSIIEALAAGISIAYRNAMLYRSEKWRVQVADSFRKVAEMMSANSALDDLLNMILEKLELNLPCDASAIWLLEDQASSEDGMPTLLSPAAVRGIDIQKINTVIEQDSDIRALLERSLAATNPLIRKPEDVFSPLGAALEFPANHSAIIAPMHAGGQPLGIIMMAHQTPSRYGSEAYDITSTYANYAALAIQNARLFSDAQEQAWLSTVLLQVSEVTQSLTTVDELLDSMVRLPPLLIGIRFSVFFLWEENFEMYNLKTWYGIEEPVQRFYDEKNTPLLADLRQSNSYIIVDNVQEKFGISLSSSDENLLVVLLPLISRGNYLGCFLVGYKTNGKNDIDGSPEQQTLSVLQGITHQTSTALENLRLEEAREEEAYVTAVLLESARAIVSKNNLNEILDTIVHLLPILVGINTCIIYIWDPQNRLFRPAQAYSSESGNGDSEIFQKTYLPGEFELLDSILEENKIFFSVSLDDNLPFPQWVNLPCYSEDNLSIFSSHGGTNLLIGLPLSSKGKCLGIILVKENQAEASMQNRRLEIVQGISQHLALALQNDIYQQEMVESERMEKEFQLARESQKTFLPDQMPSIRGWELDAHWQPARHVGGDFFDLIQLDQNRLAIVIADVSDKGMPAALYMTVSRTLIRAFAANSPSPSAILEMVNNALLPDTKNGMFVTAILIILSIRTGKMVYSNAGHNLPLLFHAKTGEVEQLHKGGMALGVLENIKLEDQYYTMDLEDGLLLYTDGVTETLSPQNQVFGENRLIDLYASLPFQDVHTIIASIEKALITFREDAPTSDDVTMVCIRRTAVSPAIRKETSKSYTPRKSQVV